MSKSLSSVSIVVADDHPVVLHGIASILQTQLDFHILELCHGGIAASAVIRAKKPDIAVLDIAMPDKSGLEVLSTIDGLRTKVIFLTATATDFEVLTAIARGAKGVMLKDSAPENLIECVREVVSGGSWLPHDIVDAALERETGRRLQRDQLDQGLTGRERDVMRLVAGGLSNKEVGRKLGMSEGTVKVHLHSIYKKVGVPNRTALVAVALAYGERERVDVASRESP